MVAAGASAARLRSYLKKMSGETWEYVSWLTHAKNAVRMDAEIGLKMVEHLLGSFTAAQMRNAQANVRCSDCESYRLVAGTCEVCGWTDPDYEPVELPELTEEEIAERLAEPCTPSSDISTFVSPGDWEASLDASTATDAKMEP